MEHAFWIGIVAALCSTTASLPQVWQSYKEKVTKDLHSFTMVIRMSGCGAWAVYGIMTEDITLAVSSTMAFFIECLLIFAKYKYNDWREPDRILGTSTQRDVMEVR